VADEKIDPDILHIWQFVRGDTSPRDFEDWLYSSTEIETRLGSLYLDVISANYKDAQVVWKVKDGLALWAREHTPLNCRCFTLPDLAVINMGHESSEILHSLKEQQSRGHPYWWLSTQKCSVCGDHWLVAREERHNDVFCMRRLKKREVKAIQNEAIWPSDFDKYEDLIWIGSGAGNYTATLCWTIQDLARARPGIAVSELIRLLNIEAPVAVLLAKIAVNKEELDITFDV